MKSITFLISSLKNSGGTQRVLSLLCNKLIVEFQIYVLVNKEGQPFFNLSDKVIQVSLFQYDTLINKNIFIYKFLKSTRSNYFVNLDSNSMLFNGLFLPKKTKLIIWEHFALSKNYNKFLYKISRFYASVRAYKFVVLTEQEREDWNLKYGVKKHKLNVISNPITLDLNEFKNAVELFQNKKILAVGNNVYVKGFDLLIRVWSLLEENGWTLEIVGLTRNELIKAKNISNKYRFKNKLILSGQITKMEDKYLESSIFCLSSRFEALPLVLIESQAIGLPAITFNNCEGPVQVLNDSGLFVNFKDIEGYKRAIEKLIKSKELYMKLSTNARENSKRFSKDKFFKKWIQILK